MGERSSGVGSGGAALKREERQQRILDAAGSLIQKWGYAKTTLADIAHEARVARGTIYQYWKTREELLLALLMREEAQVALEIERRTAADPEGMTLPAIIKHSMLATLKNPLLRAVVLHDTELLGDLAMREYSQAANRAHLQRYMALLDFLRQRGLIRSDIELSRQALMVVAVAWGFILVDPFLPDEFTFSDEETVETMSVALTRLLAPDRPPSVEERSAGRQACKVFIHQVVEMANQERV